MAKRHEHVQITHVDEVAIAVDLLERQINALAEHLSRGNALGAVDAVRLWRASRKLAETIRAARLTCEAEKEV